MLTALIKIGRKPMKIKSVRIQNLRSIKDQTIGLSDYTCLVGANGAGKSTILCALNIFFRETENSATSLSDPPPLKWSALWYGF